MNIPLASLPSEVLIGGPLPTFLFDVRGPAYRSGYGYSKACPQRQGREKLTWSLGPAAFPILITRTPQRSTSLTNSLNAPLPAIEPALWLNKAAR
jgi:hypothetical protein